MGSMDQIQSRQREYPQLVHKNEFFDVYQHAANVFVLKTASGRTPELGSNSGFVVSDKGVMVIDTHTNPETEEQALEVIERFTAQPVRWIVNTHAHRDHMGGNRVHADAEQIFVHRSILDHMIKTQPHIADKFVAIDEDRRIRMGSDVTVRLSSIGAAHSVGDLGVFVEGSKILFLGDLYVRGYIGYLGEAHLDEWIQGMKDLSGLRSTIVIPGHGQVSGEPRYFEEYTEYLEDFKKTAFAHFDGGGLPETYKLPRKWDHLTARFFLEANVNRAHELWKLSAH